jgi:hypothetical protein
MKNTFKFLASVRRMAIITLFALIWFSFIACDKSSVGANDDSFASVSAFETWLAGQPANTAETAYKAKLKVDNLINIDAVLRGAPSKYIYIDLSGSTIKSIPGNAFDSCATLTGITISNGIISIELGAFFGCRSLASVTIPDSVTNIEIGAFAACYSLPEITIPDSVANIGMNAFYDCISLVSVTFNGTIPSSGFDSLAFDGDMYDKFYATNPTDGSPGTYTRASGGLTWTRQQ